MQIVRLRGGRIVPVGVFSAVGSGVPGVMDALPWHPARMSVRNTARRTDFEVGVRFLMAIVPPISKNFQL
jgi:hypothetical protein